MSKLIRKEIRIVDGQPVMASVYSGVSYSGKQTMKVRGFMPRGGMYVARQTTQILHCEVCGALITRQQEANGGRCGKH